MTANNYTFDLTSSTNSTGHVSLPALGGIALLAGMLLASAPAEAGSLPRDNSYSPQFYRTFGQYQNVFTGDYITQRAFDFEQSMTNFYAKLLAKQEPLGADFAKVLYDNLWELYES